MEINIVRKIADKIIFCSLGLAFFLIPLFFTGLTTKGIVFEKVILFYFLVLIGISAWLIKGVIDGKLSFRKTPLDLPILSSLIFFIFSTVLSVGRKDSLIGSYGNFGKGLLAFMFLVLFYYLLINNIDKGRIKKLFFIFIASGSALIVYSFFQLLGIFIAPLGFTRSISFNPLGSPSALAVFLGIFLPFVMVAAIQSEKLLPDLKQRCRIGIGIFLGIITVLILFSLLALKAFVFWPLVIIGPVAILFFLSMRMLKASVLGFAAVIVIFLALVAFSALGRFNLMAFDFPAEINLSRKTSWEITKNALKENPIFGSGPSTFYYNFSKFKSVDLNYSPLWKARFDNAAGVFEILSDTGLGGALFLLVIALTFLSSSFVSLMRGEESREKIIVSSLFSGIAPFLISAILFPFNIALTLILVITSSLLMGAAMETLSEDNKIFNLSLRLSSKYALAFAVVLLSVAAGIIFLFITGAKVLAADVYIRKAILENDPGRRIDFLKKSAILSPYEEFYYFELAGAYLSSISRENIARDDAIKKLALAIESGKRGLALSPNSAGYNETMALIHENVSYVEGDFEPAENLYKKEMELEPNNPFPYLRMALFDMARAGKEEGGREKYIKEAIKKFDEALARKNDLGEAYYGKAIAYQGMDDPDGAIGELKKALSVSGGEDRLLYKFELGMLYLKNGKAGQKTPVSGKKGTQALTYKRNEDINMAELIFKEIISEKPDSGDSYYNLAALYKDLGETEKSKEAVRALLDILDDGAEKEFVKNEFEGSY